MIEDRDGGIDRCLGDSSGVWILNTSPHVVHCQLYECPLVELKGYLVIEVQLLDC